MSENKEETFADVAKKLDAEKPKKDNDGSVENVDVSIHTKKTLKEPCWINGKKYGPGEDYVPRDAFAIWGPLVVEEE
jgi:hypothetical protein